MQIQFGTGAYRLGESATFAAQQMLNAYVEPASPGAEVPAYVRERYGIDDFGTAGNGPIRGGAEVRGYAYFVSGSEAYRVAADGRALRLGAVSGAGPVSICGDEINVVFRVGTSLWYWNGSAFAAISDADAPRSDWLDILDGFYIGSDAASGVFRVSANRDPSSWDALDFASAEAYPDDIVTGIVDHGELILLGTKSIEVWYNSGGSDFTLSRVPAGRAEVGCCSPQAVCKIDNSVFFVGHDFVLYRLNGYSPERKSTAAIESKFKAAVDKDFICHAWTESGHKFVGIFSDDFTAVYDASTDLWHERDSYGYAFWRPSCVLECFNKVLVGDSLTNAVGELTSAVVSDWGTQFVSRGTCQPLGKDNLWIRHNRLELVFENGIGDLTETDPQVMICWSDDRGRNWSSERWRSLGAQGEYQSRVVLNAPTLGRGRSRIYRYSVSSKVRRTLIAATADFVMDGH